MQYGRMVVSAHMPPPKGKRWDLQTLAPVLPHAALSGNGALALRPAPGVYLTLHAEGRLLINGEISLEESIEHADRLASAVHCEASRFRIESLTGYAQLPEPPPDLRHLCEALGEERCAAYEPNTFAGLIVRLDAVPMALLLFESGRVVCIGARSHVDLQNGLRDGLRLIRRAAAGVQAPCSQRTAAAAAPA
jgi:TATA-box binding protein (TBP) (component of TFIID and TFIIIB)